MNRKMKRDLLKDKNLVKELYAIIKKYLPNLFNMFNNLTDLRNQIYIKYSMKNICVTRLLGLLCGITSMTSLTDKFNTNETILNISKICNQDIESIPYWETIQDVFININNEELKEFQKYIVKALIRSKMFDKYRYKGYFQLIVDGTVISNHSYNLNNNCIKKKHKDGKISYSKYILECKLAAGPI